ncbi:peroxidase-like [Pollicipes pollicipes]|uniref:peroxidase-like n=1 Tax=Pollicipes pollicipes TaxID=41117 RepID=UPI001884E8D6|nr:peroxidase-like [Pollicipes pollicipes]
MSLWTSSADEPVPGPSCEESETLPLNPRQQQFNLSGGRRRHGGKTLGIAMLGLITTVGLFLGLAFGLTSSPNMPLTPQEQQADDTNADLLMLTRRSWPIREPDHLLGAVQPLEVSKPYLNSVRNHSLLRLQQLQRLEQRLVRQDVLPPPGSASFRHQQLFLKTHETAVRGARDGLVNGWAGSRIKHDHNMTRRWFERTRQLVPVRQPASCRVPPPTCDAKARFRTADGSCNNLRHPRWGSAFTAFRRVMWPDYEDGVFFPRAAADGGYLPAPRQVCRYVFTDEYHGDARLSLLMMQWGQFIDHDVTATAAGKADNGAPIRCCGPEIDHDPSLLHPECMSLLVGFDDPQFAVFNVSCLDFVRSSPAPLCQYGPRQQLNQITAFLDGSNIYGSDDEQTSSLRAHAGGRLRVQTTEDGRELLPISADPKDGCNRNASMAVNQYCFRSGDARVNEQISLTATHTQWVRQHNLVADELADINPHWDDERTFQESRRIIAAMMQHITAAEYLPLLLGEKLARSAGLLPLKEGYFYGYSNTTDPTIANVFATAAFRFGHSQIQGLIKMMGAFDKTEDFTQLHRLFFNPTRLYQTSKMDALTRGQLNTCSRAADAHLTSQITMHLFEPDSAPTGLDLGAINVQRGRDHGLPPYNAWRRHCGLQPLADFAALRQMALQPAQVDRVEELYRSIDHVDLYVGGLLEPPLEGAAIGPTFACLLTDQFVRMKTGDRFWYETGDPLLRFSPDQLRQIRRANLARVLCDTSDRLEKAQPRPLLLPSADNAPKPCGSLALPVMDLSYWEEPAPRATTCSSC